MPEYKSHTPVDPGEMESSLANAVMKRMLQVLLTYLVLAASLLLSSGDLSWVWAWACLAVGLGILVLNVLILPAELIAERGHPRDNVKHWDKVLTSIASLATLAVPIVAGLDQRYKWSPQLIPAIHLIGLASFALGQGLFSWAMASNEYFSTAVRIQMERGHTVATGGPYRFIRHPGYTGYSVSFLAMPLALGSLWALIPAALTACLLVVRTSLEDRTLRDELPGYEEYSERVRYRLLPGVW
jgi:protein-S-isoprenylcysteine O-methyltransferase Ste14